MRKTIIDTATTLPNSAIEITKAMDAVMRTGKSYEEATVIVEKTAKLAVASGEDLANAVGIVNKLFLALDINARNTETLDKALQQLHATAVFTATDLEGLGESAKQWAGAVGGLVRTTTKTGAELETYKSQLLDMGTAFSGILSNMGRLKDVCSTSDPYVEKSA
jgi:TP901 family phage tail tape measure protein